MDRKISDLSRRRERTYKKINEKLSKRDAQLKRIEQEIRVFLMSHHSLERKINQINKATDKLNTLCRERYKLRKKVAERVSNSVADEIISQLNLITRHKRKVLTNAKE